MSSCGHYLIQMNDIVPPAEDRSDIALENNNLANIGGQKSQEVIITKVWMVVTSRKEGGGVVWKVSKGGASGLVMFPFLTEGCSLCNYSLYYTFMFSVRIFYFIIFERLKKERK